MTSAREVITRKQLYYSRLSDSPIRDIIEGPITPLVERLSRPATCLLLTSQVEGLGKTFSFFYFNGKVYCTRNESQITNTVYEANFSGRLSICDDLPLHVYLLKADRNITKQFSDRCELFLTCCQQACA